jgi:hypothetical protein
MNDHQNRRFKLTAIINAPVKHHCLRRQHRAGCAEELTATDGEDSCAPKEKCRDNRDLRQGRHRAVGGRPIHDFISEDGKLWPRIKAVAEANNCVPNML